MFKSISVIRFMTSDAEFSYVCRIIDSDFTEDVYTNSEVEGIISCYSSKNLDVVYNLYLYHLRCNKLYNPHKEELLIEMQNCSVVYPIYKKYKSDVEKYIIRHLKMKYFW